MEEKQQEECQKSFNSSNLLEILSKLYDSNLNSMEDSGLDFSVIDYISLFDPKVEDFIRDDKNFRLLTEYGSQYDTLVENSTFLKKGTFSQYNASTVNTTLDTNGFFKAGHELLLQDGMHVKSSVDFEKMLQEEKKKILSDPKLLKQFDQIDKKLSANASLRNFRNIIENYPELISQLVSYDSFKKKAWIGILKKENTTISDLIKLYKKAKEDINKIQIEAQKESAEWRQVVEIFSNRFFVTFTVHISNQEDVVLKNSVPTLSFKYREHDEEKEIELAKLTTVLSGGEKRALYLLNIIFELEALKIDCCNYILLTKLLHMKNYANGQKTKDICLQDLETVINNVWKTDKSISFGRENKSVYDLIINLANRISSDPNTDEINLENKIALSIAIRLIAEEFMISQIIDDYGSDDKIKKITGNQTGKLLSLYKKGSGTNKKMLPVLEEVSLMTAENIHLNSFMYEPLIDISIRQLKKLYSTLLPVSSMAEI